MLGSRPLRVAVAGLTVAGLAGLVTISTARPAPDDPTPEQVTPATVPAPSAGAAIIAVKVAGGRTQSNQLAPLAGVQLELYNDQAGNNDATGATWGTCISDADGDCFFEVPDAGGANRDRRFWIRQTGVPDPAQWFQNNSFMTSTNGQSFSATSYTFRTGSRLRAGETYRSTNDFMITETGAAASSGVWQTSRANPALPASCGLNVALVLDLSYSVALAGAEDELKEAAQAFTNALVGTPSRVALFTFGTSAPAGGAGNVNRPLTPVSTTAGADAVTDWIDGMFVPGASPNPGSAEYTNWDRGLFQVAQSSSSFDVAIVITDGNPTRYGATPTGSGSATRFVELEQAIFSANAIKAKDTRVIAAGVGDGVDQDPFNLIAISGQVAGDDYLQAEDYDQAASDLAALATAGCTGSLTVIKNVIPPGGTLDDALPAGGWQLAATTPTPDLGIAPTPADSVTEFGTGAVNFGLTFDDGQTSGTVDVVETQQPGYSLVPVGGGNARCTLLDGLTVVPIDDIGDPDNPGFSVPVSATEAVTCNIYNQAPTPPASLIVDKFWVIEGSDPIPNGQQPPGFSAHFDIEETTGGGSILYEDLAWGYEYLGLEAGQTGVLTEQVAISPLHCTHTGTTVVNNTPDPDVPIPPDPAGGYPATLVPGRNQFTVTNVVECDTRLTLVKEVANGDADPTEWTLTADAADGALPGPSGVSGVSGPVTPGAVYVLSEDDPLPLYVPLALPFEGPPFDPFNPPPPPGLNEPAPPPGPAEGSVGSWFCAELDDDGNMIGWMTEGLYGAITVPYGAFVTCAIVNATVELTLFKLVVDDSGQPTAEADDWDLTATPTGPLAVPGLPTETVTDGTTVFVRPGQDYRLTEASDAPGASRYSLSQIYCLREPLFGDVEEFTLDLDDPVISAGVGAEVLCEFANVATIVSTVKTNTATPGAPVAVGDTFDYVLTVSDSPTLVPTVPTPAIDVVVTDSVPPQLRVTNVVVPAGWTNETVGNAVRATTALLADGASAEIRVTVEVLPEAAGMTGTLRNSACVEPVNAAPTDDPCDDSDIIPPPPTTDPSTTSSSSSSTTTIVPPTSATIAPSSSVAPGPLPPTGADSTRPVVWIALTAILFGSVLLGVRRTRRPASPGTDL